MTSIKCLFSRSLASVAASVAVGAIGSLASSGAAAATCDQLNSVNVPFASKLTATLVSGGTFTPPTGAPLTGLPSFCRVSLTMAPTSDSSILVEVWLPQATWNGRLQGIGGGGYTGSVNFAALAAATQQGYASVNTDMGTVPATVTNGVSLVGHPQKWLDFGSRSTHEMTVAAQILASAFYERKPHHAYYVGCSTGGHQGLEEAQVFPNDYDGIIAGAPGHNRTHLHETFVYDWTVSHKPGGAVISPAKLTMLHDAALSHCAGTDGGLASDAFLTNPRACHFDPAVLQCKAGDAANCLTAGEVETAHRMYDGLRNPRTNDLIYPGWAIGSEVGWTSTQGGSAAAFPGILNWALGADYDPLSVNWDTDVAKVDATLAPTVNFLDSNLSRFYGHGGKLMMYHGFADPIVVTQDTINYYERLMSEGKLTLAQARDFARLFLVPGMGHCSGGDGPNTFDTLTPLVNWVENGQAPEAIVATKYVNNDATAGVQMTRPLCAYPDEAKYSGKGSPNDAANWTCGAGGASSRVTRITAPEYLAPLVIQARAVPDTVNLRTSAGLVTVVLTAPATSDDFTKWIPGDIRAEGAVPVSAARSADARSYVVTFRRSDLMSFSGGKAAGAPVDLMLTGTLQHDGIQSLFAASATVKLVR